MASKPERGGIGNFNFVDIEIGVSYPKYENNQRVGEKEEIIPLRAGGDLMELAESLEVNQMVQVVCKIRQVCGTNRDGKEYNFTDIKPAIIVPGPAPAPAQQGYQRPAPAPGGNYGSVTYTPPRNAKEAAQLPHEDDDDIPF